MRTLKVTLPLAAAVAVAAMLVGGGAMADDGDLSILGNKRSVVAAFVKAKKDKKGASQFECNATPGGANTNLDCDDPFPNNEPDLEVDPADPLHMVASSNDYGSCCDQYYTTFDGGANWSTGNMSIEKPGPLGPIGSDPVTVFDTKHDMTLHSSLNFFLSKDFEETCNGDVVVSPSKDGGLTWERPVVVDQGVGCDLDKLQIFNDKEWIVTDNNPSSKYYGRTYLTWTAFFAHNGEFASAPIMESHSDDGGKHWSKAQEISGKNKDLCTFQTSGHDGVCDENQFSVPTVGPDGAVYVAFENSQNESLWETGEVFDDQYLLVKSTDGGHHWSKPTFITGLEDGSNDYPINVDGRQTPSGYQVRLDSAGNIVAGATAGSLYLTFSDNRNGIHDTSDPVTNLDVFVMSSSNGGATWSSPSLVDAAAGDQWFPWVEVNPVNGKIGVAYNDRGASNGTFYGASLAEGMPGSFVKTPLNTAPSDPVHSIFFQAEDPDCMACAVFNGDYINVTYGSDGHANVAWTDMRDFRDADEDLGTDAGFAQFIYFARK
jgi:hypothetical protein